MENTIYKTVAVEIEIDKMNYIYRDCILYGTETDIKNELHNLSLTGSIDIYEEKTFSSKKSLDASIKAIKNIFSKDEILKTTRFINCEKINLKIAN